MLSTAFAPKYISGDQWVSEHTMNTYMEAVRGFVLFAGLKDPESMLSAYRTRPLDLLKRMNRWGHMMTSKVPEETAGF